MNIFKSSPKIGGGHQVCFFFLSNSSEQISPMISFLGCPRKWRCFYLLKKNCWSTFSLLNTDSRAKLEHTLFMVYGLSFIHIFTFQNYVFNSILKMVSNGKLVENRFWLMIVIIVEVSILWIFLSYCTYIYFEYLCHL